MLMTLVASVTASPRAALTSVRPLHARLASSMSSGTVRRPPRWRRSRLAALSSSPRRRSSGRMANAPRRVYPAAHGHFASADIYNAEPAELGFYCLCSKRPRTTHCQTVPVPPLRLEDTPSSSHPPGLTMSRSTSRIGLRLTQRPTWPCCVPWRTSSTSGSSSVARHQHASHRGLVSLAGRRVRRWARDDLAVAACHVYNNATRAAAVVRVPGKPRSSSRRLQRTMRPSMS